MAAGSKRPWRIAYGRLMQETNALSPVLTTRADFARTHLLAGAELERCVDNRLAPEVPGYARNAELSGFHRVMRKEAGPDEVELVPLYSAWAVSGGPLAKSTIDEFIAELVQRLQEAQRDRPLDGVYLALHGAMGAEGEPDPEARLLNEVRRVVGQVPISVSFDMHGLLTREKMANLDLVSVYRTNPHRDHAQTGARAGRMLATRLRRGAPLATAWRSLPMVMGGGPGVDFMAPMRRVFRHLAKLDDDKRIADSSLCLCHPWNDHPELGWSVWVAAHDDQALAERVADDIADRAWATRHDPVPPFHDAEAAIAEVRGARLRRRLGTACLCDASDVVGAGGTGESTYLLKALLDGATDMVSFVPIRDEALVLDLWARQKGERVAVSVGGRLGDVAGPPLSVSGVLREKVVLPAFGKSVLLDLGHVQLVVTEAPPLVMKPNFYRSIGLDPFRADITVVKSFFPFRIFFLAENRLTLYVRTRGITDLDAVSRIKFAGPVHPFEELADWRPEDARRRGC